MTSTTERALQCGWYFTVWLALALILYGRTLAAYFLADDFVLIGGVATHGLFSLPSFVRPVVMLTYLCDYSIWGLRPIGFHLTNVILHTLNAMLVGALAAALHGVTARRVARSVPLLATAAFLALPTHTESVAWISGRTDLVASMFMLVSLLAHLARLESGRPFALAVSLMAFALALLSKESAIAFPPVVALLSLILTRRIGAAAHATAPFLVVLASYALLRRRLMDQLVGGYGTSAHLAWDPEQAVLHLAAATLRVISPLPEPIAGMLERNWYLSPRRTLVLSVCVGALVFAALWALRVRKWSPTWVLIGSLVLCFWLSVPLLGALHVSLVDTLGERFLYFPSVFAVAIVCIAMGAERYRSWRTGAVVAWIVVSSVVLWHLNGTWATAGELADRLAREAAGSVADGQFLVVTNLPDNYRGAYVFRNGFKEAMTIFRRSGASAERIEVLSSHPVRRLDDDVIVTKEGPRWVVELVGEPPPSIRLLTDVAVVSLSSRSFAFEIGDHSAVILSYGKGRMRAVAP
jgi:hypothetical protein